MSRLVGGIEAGGTKFRVAVGHGNELRADTTIPTTSPAETLGAAVSFLEEHDIAGVGIACFGPVDIDQASPTFGHTLATPKPGWSNVDVVGPVADVGLPVAIDSDVAAAGLAEWKWGAGRGHRSVLYLTIGTGIGGALIIDGKPHHGHGHSEMGHIAMERFEGDQYAGTCPYHSACFEGMASGPAIAARWGKDLSEAGSRAVELEAAYLAQAVRGLTYVLAPDVVVLGGGVMQTAGLLDQVRARLVDELGGYATSRRPLDDTDFLVGPELGQDAGLYGALALADG